MKLLKKLCLSILGLLLFVGVLLFVCENYFFQSQDKALISTQSKSIAQNNSIILQEAKRLLSEGYRGLDNNLIQQAVDKYSIWLEQNVNNPDKKLITGVLVVRANALLRLKKFNEAIHDFRESIEYNHSGELQFGICMIEKQQGNLSALHDCYVKAVRFFENKKVSRINFNFLIARILSGDKSAIIEYKNVFQTLTGNEKWMYEEAAKGLFDNTIYKEITGKDCEDCGNFQFFQ